MIIRDDRIVAAGALLPLAETSIHTERFGTRHRAALGITEQTDAVVVVVSEENGQISLVERARIVRNLTEAGLARAIQTLLDPATGGAARSAGGRRPRAGASRAGRRGCASSAGWSVGRPGAGPRDPVAPARRPRRPPARRRPRGGPTRRQGVDRRRQSRAAAARAPR